jgi:sulfate adenylyltransferase subunit 2
MHQLTTTGASRALPKHLKRLDAESIEMMRDVIAEFKKPAMMYSIDKDCRRCCIQR